MSAYTWVTSLDASLWWPAGPGLVALVAALRHLPWSRFRNPSFQHVYPAACVAVFMLWMIRAAVGPDMTIHLLGVTALTLMFGWALAIVATAVVSFALGLAGIESWVSVPEIFLARGVAPVAVSWLIYRWSQAALPHHFFIYIFVCAFAGAALASTAGAGAHATLLWLRDTQDVANSVATLGAFWPLYAYPEAFVNGFIMTWMVVMRPHWVSSFDDAVYLKKE